MLPAFVTHCIRCGFAIGASFGCVMLSVMVRVRLCLFVFGIHVNTNTNQTKGDELALLRKTRAFLVSYVAGSEKCRERAIRCN